MHTNNQIRSNCKKLIGSSRLDLEGCRVCIQQRTLVPTSMLCYVCRSSEHALVALPGTPFRIMAAGRQRAGVRLGMPSDESISSASGEHPSSPKRKPTDANFPSGEPPPTLTHQLPSTLLALATEKHCKCSTAPRSPCSVREHATFRRIQRTGGRIPTEEARRCTQLHFWPANPGTTAKHLRTQKCTCGSNRKAGFRPAAAFRGSCKPRQPMGCPSSEDVGCWQGSRWISGRPSCSPSARQLHSRTAGSRQAQAPAIR